MYDRQDVHLTIWRDFSPAENVKRVPASPCSNLTFGSDGGSWKTDPKRWAFFASWHIVLLLHASQP